VVGLFLFALVLVPIVLAFALRKTPVWWLPAVGLLAGAAALVIAAAIATPEHGDESSPWAGIAAAVDVIFAALLGVYGFILLAITSKVRTRAARAGAPPPPDLPTATAREHSSASSANNPK
jgi:hypothetical protein